MDRFTQANYKGGHEHVPLVFSFLFVTLTAVGLLANMLVVVAFLGKRKMRENSMNLLLSNLVGGGRDRG